MSKSLPSHVSLPPSESADLTQARQRNWLRFRRLLRQDETRAPDYLLVTTAHEGQAAGCREELKSRQERGLLPARTQGLVVADPAGQRVGSGGATLLVLAEMARRSLGRSPRCVEDFRQAFRGKRTLLIHSGGDSRRLPHESPLGKAFSPLPALSPLDGPYGAFRETWTAFDELLVSLSVLLSRMPEGLVVAAGDVVVLMDAASIPLRRGVMGLACPAPSQVAEKHGIYCVSADGTLRAFLQHPADAGSEATLRPEAGSSEAPTVDVDTGVICFDAEAAAGLAGLGVEISFASGAGEPMDLYRHLLPTLALPPQERRGLPVGWPKRIAAEFSATRLSVHRLRPGLFADLDSTVEFAQAFTQGVAGLTPHPRPRHYASHLGQGALLRCTCGAGISEHLGLRGQSGNRVVGPPSPPACERPIGVLVASRIDGEAHRLSVGAVLEWCDLSGDWSLAEGALACDVRQPGVPFHLGPGVVAHRLPVVLPGTPRQPLSVLRLYGTSDDPKLRVQPQAPGAAPQSTLFGTPLLEWLAQHGIPPEAVWPEVPPAERSLWNARLYAAAPPPEDLTLSLWMQEAAAPSPSLLERWLACPRLSLEQCFHVVDLAALRRERQRLLEEIELLSWTDLLRSDVDSAALLAAASVTDLTPGRSPIERLLARGPDPLLQARAYRVLADFHRGLAEKRAAAALVEGLVPPVKASSDGRGGAPRPTPRALLRERATALEVEAFRKVAEAIRSQWSSQPASLALKPGQATIARSPARLDFGGGWSDTPPHSLERGGVVLNAAVTLEGRAPIVAEVRALRRPELRLTARDLGKTRTLDSLAEATAYGDPSNPFALHKAALVYTGVLPEQGGTLKQALRRFGGGLEVATESRVPKGSGLGTSSILAAALLQALWRAVGVEATQEEIYEGVLAIEQMLTTGGGWQDQIGGAVPGIKLIRTEPGIPQRPIIEPVALSPKAAEALHSRLVLFYTGQRRLARNILRTVMGGYLARLPETCRVLREIQDIAVEMKECLETNDLDRFGALMTRHWELNKLMDPHSSNSHIEALFAAATPHISGGKLVGAGGGGFMELIARSPHEVPALQRALQSAGAYYVPYELDLEGLRSEVTA